MQPLKLSTSLRCGKAALLKEIILTFKKPIMAINRAALQTVIVYWLFMES